MADRPSHESIIQAVPSGGSLGNGRPSENDAVNNLLETEEEALVEYAKQISLRNSESWNQSDTNSIHEFTKFLKAFIYTYVNEVNNSNLELFNDVFNETHDTNNYLQYKSQYIIDDKKLLSDDNIHWSKISSVISTLQSLQEKLRIALTSGLIDSNLQETLNYLKDQTEYLINCLDLFLPPLWNLSSRIELDDVSTSSNINNMEDVIEALRGREYSKHIEALLYLTKQFNNTNTAARKDILSHMKAFDVLKVLLSNFSKFSGEVEYQATKLLSILVIYEEDDDFSVRNMNDLLSQLCMIQMNSVELSKNDLESAYADIRSYSHRNSIDASEENYRNMNIPQYEVKLDGFTARSRRPSVSRGMIPLSDMTIADGRQHHPRYLELLSNYQSRLETRILISAAIVKLSQVIKRTWNLYGRYSNDHMDSSSSSPRLDNEISSPGSDSHKSKSVAHSEKYPSSPIPNNDSHSGHILNRKVVNLTNDTIKSLLNVIIHIYQESIISEDFLEFCQEKTGIKSLKSLIASFSDWPESPQMSSYVDGSRQRKSWTYHTSRDFTINNLNIYYELQCALVPEDEEYDLQRVDRSIVLCSIAISHLTDHPRLRQITVADSLEVNAGMFSMLKSWFVKGIERITSESKEIQQNLDDTTAITIVNIFDERTSLYQLLYHSSLSIMYILGGSIDNGHNNPDMEEQSLNRNDFIETDQDEEFQLFSMALCDEKIFECDIDSTIAKFLNSSLELYRLTAPLYSNILLRISLPRNLFMCLSQALYQLCSRATIDQLQRSDLSLALCEVFTCTVNDNLMTTKSMKYSISQPGKARSSTHDTRISSMSLDSSLLMSRLSDMSASDIKDVGPTSDFIDDDIYHLSFAESSTICSSLDSLACFIHAAVTFAAITASMNSAAHLVDHSIPSRFTSYSSSIDETTASTFNRKDVQFIDRMCEPAFMDAIKIVASQSPRGHPRLCCLRIVALLSELPEYVKSVAESDLPSVLLKICADLEDVHMKEDLVQIHSLNQPNIFAKSNVTTAPALKRNKTETKEGETTLMNLSMTNPGLASIKAKGIDSKQSNQGRQTTSGLYDLSSHDSFKSNAPSVITEASTSRRYEDKESQFPMESTGSSVRVDDVSAKIAQYDTARLQRTPSYFPSQNQISYDEAERAIYCLANIIQSKRSYGSLLLANGMLKIAILLLNCDHMEICRHAVRCISSLCPIIASISVNVMDGMIARRDDKMRDQQAYNRKYDYCKEALVGCTRGWNHQQLGPAVKKEALLGLAALGSISDDTKYLIHDEIVDGPLYSIVTMLIDHEQANRDVQAAGEEVLKSLGFTGGMDDLRLSSFSFEMLSEWYMIRRSLKPQSKGFDLLSKWLEDMFTPSPDGGSNWLKQTSMMDESRFNVESSQSDSTKYRNFFEVDIANEIAGILRIQLPDSLYAHQNNMIHKQEHKFFSRKHIAGIIRALPFCFGTAAANEIIREEEHENDYRSSTHSNYEAATPSMIDRPSAVIDRPKSIPNLTTTPLSAMTPQSPTPIVKSSSSHAEWRDHVPKSVTDVFDLLVVSRLHQLWLSDLSSIGIIDITDLLLPRDNIVAQASVVERPSISGRISTPSPSGSSHGIVPVAIPVSGKINSTPLTPFPYIIPHLHVMRTLVLPKRMYSGDVMNRYSRIIERIIADEGVDNVWSMCFSDSTFCGDFHQSLLATLGKCSSIVSVSFTGTEVENEMHLGYLVGHLPSNIRFVGLNGCVSQESVQAMCILLKRNNTALIRMAPRDVEIISNEIITRLLADVKNDESRKANQSDKKIPSFIRASLQELARSRPLKGLLGLSITHKNLSELEIDHIIDLLTIFTNDQTVEQSNNGSNHPNSKESAVLQSPSQMPAQMSANHQGLRYLDLSFNNLNDHACSRILRGASNGPLEGLDLSGNPLDASYAFDSIPSESSTVSSQELSRSTSERLSHSIAQVDLGFLKFQIHSSLDPSQSRKISYLRHLNLSGVGMPARSVITLLKQLYHNHSLCSLDLSYNVIHHDESSKETIRETGDTFRDFLRMNKCLRLLDLSYMNIRFECLKKIQLGLLENRTMLLISMTGNPVIEGSYVTQEIQNLLANNRIDYSRSSELSRQTNSDINKKLESEFQAVATMKSESTTIQGAKSPTISESNPSSSSLNLSVTEEQTNTLHVLFSAPLAWRDRSGQIHPLELLDYNRERESIIQVLREVHRDLSVEFGFATTQALRNALSLNCRALHFSGHGHKTYLNFEDGNSGLQLLPPENVVNLIAAGGNLKLQFVFVSACFSRITGQAFVDAGVPHVVCCKVDEMILDSAATAFTRAFYVAFLSGSTVREAFSIAKEALKANPLIPDSSIEGEKFVLLPEGNPQQHDRVIFSCPIITYWPAKRAHVRGRSFTATSWLTFQDDDEYAVKDTTLTFLHTLPAPTPDFEGRETDMYRAITTIATKQHVTLVGDYGVGKSALTSAICNYVADRGMFEHGVLYVKVPPSSTIHTFVTLLVRAMTNESKNIRTASVLSNRDHRGIDFVDASPQNNRETILAGSESVYVSTLSNGNDSDQYMAQEEFLISRLTPTKLLLVVDNIDNILPKDNETAANLLKSFLSRLYEKCRYIKLLVTSTEPLRLRGVKDFGAVEATVSIGPLTIRSSLRLFAKLAPPLISAREKTNFINSLLPKNQANATLTNSDVNLVGAKILGLFGQGHPARIVKLASQSTPESIKALLKQGMDILADKPSTGISSNVQVSSSSELKTNIDQSDQINRPRNYISQVEMSQISSSSPSPSPRGRQSRRPSMSLQRQSNLSPSRRQLSIEQQPHIMYEINDRGTGDSLLGGFQQYQSFHQRLEDRNHKRNNGNRSQTTAVEAVQDPLESLRQETSQVSAPAAVESTSPPKQRSQADMMKVWMS